MKNDCLNDYIEKENEFYNKLINNINEEDKKALNINKTITIENQNISIFKKNNSNIIYIIDNKNGAIQYFLRKTIFIENSKIFSPISNIQTRIYLSQKKNYLFLDDTKLLNEKEVYDICRQGEGKIIHVKFAPFLVDLNETIFNQKNSIIKYDELSLDNLSLFYLEYFPFIEDNNKDFKFIYSEKRKQFFKEIKQKIYLEPDNQIIELYGPFGIGKSTSLLAFQKSELEMRNAYFNLDTLFRIKDKNKLIHLILYESMTLCNTYEEFQNLEKYIRSKNIYRLEFLDIIKEIMIFISNKTFNNSIIIFDQYKDVFQDKKIYFDGNFKLTIKDNILRKFTIIKCSSMNDSDVKNNFINALDSNTKYIYIDKLFEIDILDEKEKLFLGSVPLYHYLFLNSRKKNVMEFINEEKEIIKNEIRNKIPNCQNLLSTISKVLNIIKNSIKYNLYELKEIISLLPLKYLTIKEIKNNNDTYFTFDYLCFLIKVIFEELAVEEFKKLREISGINKIKEMLGGIFEIICHFAILSNKLEYFNLNINNLFYLDKNLYDKSESKSNWIFNKNDSGIMKTLNSFYIRPTNSNSEFYDSVIIFKNKDGDYCAYLLQMSISEESGIKIKSRKEHLEAIEVFKEKIKIVYDIIIKDVYFSYIFNFDEINHKDIIECIRLDIDCFYYSMNLDNFYQSKEKNDLINFKTFPTNNFLSEMKYLKNNTELIKSSQQLNKEKEYITIMLMKKHKRLDEKKSIIIGDLQAVKKLIPKNKSFYFHNYIESGNARLILDTYNKGKYFCILKDNQNKIYAIYGNNYYIYENNDFKIIKENFIICYQILDDENFEIEIFYIV